MSDPSSRTVTVIVEWDNADAGEIEATATLDALADELPVEGWEVDVLLVNPSHAAAGPAPTLARSRLAARKGVGVLDVGAVDYYEQKNAGAAKATGDVVVFLDSDSVPAPGWLGALLEPFRSEAPPAVVAGHTVLPPPRGLLQRWFALNWKFSADQPDGVDDAVVIRANNVAFRADVIARHRFPDDRRYRGRCASLRRTLRNEGIGVHGTTRARVEHGYPQRGIFWKRALADGHDRAVALPGRAKRFGYRRAVRALASDLRRYSASTIGGRRDVGLRAVQVPAALAIGVAWSLAAFAGALVELLRPGLLRRRLRV